MTRKDFEKLLLQAVDEGLSSLGDSSRQAIYFHLERSFNIKRQEIPCKIEFFIDAIENIFGSGARFLEILIMKRLHEKLEGELNFDESREFTFPEYVTAAKRNFLGNHRARNLMELIRYEEAESEA